MRQLLQKILKFSVAWSLSQSWASMICSSSSRLADLESQMAVFPLAHGEVIAARDEGLDAHTSKRILRVAIFFHTIGMGC